MVSGGDGFQLCLGVERTSARALYLCQLRDMPRSEVLN